MPRILSSLALLGRIAKSFAANRRGNVAIIVAAAMIPMVGLVGLGTDYGVALTDKSKLDNAADAAAIAAVATAKAFVAANQNDANLSSDAITAGLNQATRSFNVNMGGLPFATVPVPATYNAVAPATNNCAQATACIYLTQSGQTFSSTVYYSTATQNHFGQLFGYPTINVLGAAAATAQIPSYLDFYILVDVSGSMGLAATTTGQATLMSQFGCQFACHFPGQTAAYTYALANNIQLRSGAVNSAVCGLLNLAQQPSVPNQYRVGVYPFITQMAVLAPLAYADTNYSTLAAQTGCNVSPQTTFTNLLDTGTTQLYTGSNPSTGVGSGGTHFEGIFNQIQNTISSFGNGATSATSKPFVFLITDGMQNSQYFDTVVSNKLYYPGNPSTFAGYNSAWWTGSSPASMDATKCSALQQVATISVLYIPYGTLTVGAQNQGETNDANNAIPNIPTALTSCATTGFFKTANTPADISAALAAMFQQAVQVAHLSR